MSECPECVEWKHKYEATLDKLIEATRGETDQDALRRDLKDARSQIDRLQKVLERWAHQAWEHGQEAETRR